MKEKERCSTCGFSSVNLLALISTEPATRTPVICMASGGSDSSFRAQRAFSCTIKSCPAWNSIFPMICSVPSPVTEASQVLISGGFSPAWHCLTSRVFRAGKFRFESVPLSAFFTCAATTGPMKSAHMAPSTALPKAFSES